VQAEIPRADNGDAYVISLLRAKREELDRLERQRERGVITKEHYLSCRQALFGAIRELNRLLEHVSSGRVSRPVKGTENGRDLWIIPEG
jgi:hypothetical protein